MKKIVLMLTMLAVLAPAALLANGQQGDSKTKTVNLVYANWEEGVAWTHFLATVLVDEYGYEVNLTAADVAPAI